MTRLMNNNDTSARIPLSPGENDETTSRMLVDIEDAVDSELGLQNGCGAEAGSRDKLIRAISPGEANMYSEIQRDTHSVFPIILTKV